jgi:hypothetical protein
MGGWLTSDESGAEAPIRRRNSRGQFERRGEDDALWLRVQRDYEQNIGTIAELCERHEISEWQLRYRIRSQRWQLRVALPEDSRKRLVNRLLVLLGKQIARLEHRMNVNGKRLQSSEDLNAMSTALGRLAVTLEKLAAMTKDEGKTHRESEAMLELRAKIAHRIEQLNQG